LLHGGPTVSEITQKIQEGFIPLIRQTPGFVAYYWPDTGEGKGASFTLGVRIKSAQPHRFGLQQTLSGNTSLSAGHTGDY